MEDFEEEKFYDIKVTIRNIHSNIPAFSIENAIDNIKELYHEEYGVNLTDDEIEIIAEWRTVKNGNERYCGSNLLWKNKNSI